MKHSEYSLMPIFVAIMEERTLSGAAKKLKITQPAVSQGLKRLRELYNDNLFIREGRGVAPTAYATSIYPTLLESVSAINSTIPDRFKFNPKTCTRKFTISSLSFFSHTFYPRLSKIINERAPLSTVEILPVLVEDIETQMRFEKIDLLIEAESKARHTMRSKVITSDSISVLYSKNHPRLTSSITEDEFFRERHVVHNQNSGVLGYLSDEPTFASLLSKRNVAWTVSNIVDMLPLISTSEMVGIAPKIIADQYSELFNLHNVRDSFLNQELNVAMCWHPSKHQDPAHRWFRSVCEEAASYKMQSTFSL